MKHTTLPVRTLPRTDTLSTLTPVEFEQATGGHDKCRRGKQPLS